MPRLRTLVALVCICLVVFAAFTSGVATHDVAIVLDPVWVLFIPQQRTYVARYTIRVAEQTLALISQLFSRPPPKLA